MAEGYEVVWPRGRRTQVPVALARRLDTLQGETIAFLWDWAFRGELIFPVMEQELAKRFPGAKFVGYKVFGSTHGGKEAEAIASLPGKLKQNKVDAAISGVGC